MALLHVLRRTSGWLAIVVATAYVSGCCAARPRAQTDERLDALEARLTPAPAPLPQVPPPTLVGTYDDGLMAGEEAAEEKNVAGYVALGVIAAPLMVLCLVAAAGGGGGGGGNCGGGSLGDSERVAPPDATVRSPQYVEGYNSGYNARLEKRRGNAFVIGLVGGLGILAIGALIYSADANRRERLERDRRARNGAWTRAWRNHPGVLRMAYEIHMVETPASLPEGFPPVDEKDLGYYRLRLQDGLMLLDLMVGYGAVVEIPPTPETVLGSPAHTGAFLRQDGTVVTPAHCAHIARTLRPILQDGVPPEVLADLAAGWNTRADERKAEFEARGEIALAGFEHFSYDEPTLRNFVIHWGFFNAIAAEHGGYTVS